MKDILDLTPTELGELIRNNDAFRDYVIDSIADYAEHFNDEVLFDYEWEYSISNSRSDYLHMPEWTEEDIEKFVWWYREVQAKYELFDKDDDDIISEYINAARSHIANADEYDRRDEMDIRLIRAGNDAHFVIYEKLRSLYDYDDERLLDEADYVIWCEFRDGDYYVTDDWNIVKDVPEVVIARHMETIF